MASAVSLVLGVSSPLLACSNTAGGVTSGESTGTGASTTTAGTGGEVAQMSPPQVVNLTNNPPLKAPKVQLIVYAEDSYAPDVEKFLTELTQTSTWGEQTSEYGVGALTVLPTISISGTPPQTLDDNTGSPTPFEVTLATNTSGASPAWGAADPSTIYLFVLPVGTQVSSQGLCCDPTSGYYGYHYEAPVGSINVPYAVVCNCPSLDMPPLTALEWVTTSVSHELVEAATNPYVNSAPAWSQADAEHIIWNIGTFGGEIADMCQDDADTNYLPPGSTYMVQRSWSNKAAKAGSNPCVPAPPTGAYFNSYPTLPDTVSLAGGTSLGGPFPTRGVAIPIGQTRTIDVVLGSDGATSGAWTVAVQDLTAFTTGDPSSAATDVSLDKTTGSDGDVLHLTIKVLSADPSFGGEGFLISSTLGKQNNLWFGAVAQ